MPTNESLKNILDKDAETDSLKDLLKMSPSVLQGVSDGDADLLKQAFNIRTIEDMGTNKFFLWAQALTVLAAYEK